MNNSAIDILKYYRPRIKVLPETIVNQISAGEVVDRPASVVRELLDNALDAGADDILISVEDGGRRSIRIVDNGSGMSKDDALLAFENHATSKITSVKDLAAIQTFGFRGEALASIASIAKVQLRSRTRDSDIGISINIEGGKIVKFEETSCNVGTEIIVSSLFFNTPARRKFLKKPETEEARIKQWIIQSAISNFSVRYRFQANRREQLNLPVCTSLIERARAFIKGSIEVVSWEKGEIKIHGLIGHPGSATTNTSSFVLIVNKRVVKDNALLKAVREGFQSTLKSYESPVGIVSIVLPYSQVDVNVHPQKSEVRFLSPGEIYVNLRDAIINSVRSFNRPISISPISYERDIANAKEAISPEQSTQSVIIRDDSSTYQHQDRLNLATKVAPMAEFNYQNGSRDNTEILSSNSLSQDDNTSDQVQTLPKFRYADLKYIGQLMECYLVCEHNELFYLIDMHAAHERCNYNRIRNGFIKQDVSQQLLLVPVVVTLDDESLQNVMENRDTLNRLGFEIEEFGSQEIIVRSTPSFIPANEVKSLFSELARQQLDLPTSTVVSDQLDRIAARIACHSSIRSGKIMSKDEVYALFDQLDVATISSACPHGRPVIVSFTQSTVEKWFGRDR